MGLRNTERTTKLYRHFDAKGTLLYVGISLDALNRLAQHREHARWYEEIATVQVETFPTRAAALAAEVVAIRSEKPLHNVQHSSQRDDLPDREDARKARLARKKEADERAWRYGGSYIGVSQGLPVFCCWPEQRGLVFLCLCGKRHSHGAGAGHRSAHCEHPELARGYIVTKDVSYPIDRLPGQESA